MLASLQAPNVLLSPDRQWLALLQRPALAAIADLAKPEVAIAGLRLNPQSGCLARTLPYSLLTIKALTSDTEITVPLPDPARLLYPAWSLDGRRLAFCLVQEVGLELWVLTIPDGTLTQLTGPILSDAQGRPYHWLPGDAGLIAQVIPEKRGSAPVAPTLPAGPRVEENLGRKTAQRTFTNLLASPHDEALFVYYLTTTVEHIDLAGQRQTLVPPGLIKSATPAPNGEYLLLKTWHPPFSYQVPISYFPQQSQVIDLQGQVIAEIADLPLADAVTTQIDSVRPGPRGIYWRADQPATLTWLEALDGGDAEQVANPRDALWQLPAPFERSAAVRLAEFELRVRQVLWGDESLALVKEGWYDSRQQRLWQINPALPGSPPKLQQEWHAEDAYNHPGTPLTTAGAWGWEVLQLSQNRHNQGQSIFLSGGGASPEGVYPFLDRFDLETQTTERLWRCQEPFYESVNQVLDQDGSHRLTLRQSLVEPPNVIYYQGDQSFQLTHNPDPAPQLADLYKEVVHYQRHDGVDLSATLYLPPGYQGEALPTIFWIYPREFKQKDLAGQNRTPVNTFSRPRGASPLYFLTQGYALLASPSLPIIGEGEVEANDSYIEQLIAGAKAAVDYVVNRGVTDPNRIGVGGHSYGAFTTANLLAHTDLFQAGIARSGAYNRTLTPFGFQEEQRHYWQAVETYTQISPFTHADKIKQPLLLIHGMNDSNAGTYPMQSERFYQALKGVGATTRLVLLPGEDHGYSSQEAVGHVLWEMVKWFDTYVKKSGDGGLLTS
jgi:dipeptidyl aminopeptidase/acylaminoacyl peptidase